MKRFLVGVVLFTLSVSCNQAKFGGDANKKNNNTTDQIPLSLTVTTPADTIEAGKNPMQATAVLKGVNEAPDVIWTLTSETSDKGTIDEKGLYTSPETAQKEFPLTIVATLKSDPRVSGSKTIRVIPKEIFVACTEGSESFPIKAEVYQMNPNVHQLPDYNDPNQAVHKTTVCMEKYAVEPRNFEKGFPKVEELYEYFSLQTTTTLIVPADGVYTFELNSDDGSRLYIDGQEVIDNDGEHQAFGSDPEDSQTEGLKTADIYLTKGEHPLALNYFQGPRFRIGLMLKWKVPGSHHLVYVPRASFK